MALALQSIACRLVLVVNRFTAAYPADELVVVLVELGTGVPVQLLGAPFRSLDQVLVVSD